MRKRLEKLIFLAVMVAALATMHLYVTFYGTASRSDAKKVVRIERGTSFRVIARNLEKAGIVRDARSFVFAASLLGAYRSVKAGEYELSGSMTPVEVLRTLVKGRVRTYRVTIPEGYNIREVASAFEAAGLADAREFTRKATDARFAASLGITGATLEGYLFPDTYRFARGVSVDEIIKKMVARFKSVYYPTLDRAARKKGMSTARVVTLASIIEKETGSAGERRLISAVFHNRLKKKIRLQSDPTVIYGIADFNGNLTKKDLRRRTAYNTYRFRGLPPGPIANPGRAALEAAIDPAHEDYLYFVSKNDGTHYFSKSLREHNNAVNRFQRRRYSKYN